MINTVKSPITLFSIYFFQSKKVFPFFFWERIWVDAEGGGNVSENMLCVASWSRGHYMFLLSCNKKLWPRVLEKAEVFLNSKSKWTNFFKERTNIKCFCTKAGNSWDKSLAHKRAFQRSVTMCMSCCETSPKVHFPGCCWRMWQSSNFKDKSPPIRSPTQLNSALSYADMTILSCKILSLLLLSFCVALKSPTKLSISFHTSGEHTCIH